VNAVFPPLCLSPSVFSLAAPLFKPVECDRGNRASTPHKIVISHLSASPFSSADETLSPIQKTLVLDGVFTPPSKQGPKVTRCLSLALIGFVRSLVFPRAMTPLQDNPISSCHYVGRRPASFSFVSSVRLSEESLHTPPQLSPLPPFSLRVVPRKPLAN